MRRARSISPPELLGARALLLSPVPIADPERVRGPLLVVASEQEPMAAQVSEQYRRAPEPKQLVFLPGTAHGQHIFASDQAERLKRTIADFLEQRTTSRSIVDPSASTSSRNMAWNHIRPGERR